MCVKIFPAGIIYVEGICQGIDLFPWDGAERLDFIVAQIDLYVINLKIACKDIAVVGKNVATLGANCVHARQLSAGALVPVFCLDYSGIEQLDHNRCAKDDEKETYQPIAEEYMIFIILLKSIVLWCHRLSVRKGVVLEIRD